MASIVEKESTEPVQNIHPGHLSCANGQDALEMGSDKGGTDDTDGART